MTPTPEITGDARHFPSQLIFGARRLDIPYEEWVTNWDNAQQYVGQAHYEVTKKDHDSYTIRRFAAVDLSDYWLAYDGIERRMRLPDVLHSIDVSYEKGGGATDYFENGSSLLVGNGGVGVNVSGSAQASAFCIPKLIPQVTETWSFNPPVTHYFYYGQAFDSATVLAKLSAKLGVPVLAWPVFKPESLIFKLVGTRVSATGRASFQGSQSVHGSDSSNTSFNGFSWGLDVAPIIETMSIPPTLHGALTLAPPSDGQSYNATTAVVAAGAVPGGGANIATASSSGSITPTSISATSPTALPSSGLYVFDFDIQPDNEFGWYFGHAIVFDFSKLN